MGLAFSCPGDDALDESFEALLMRSISLNGDNAKSTLHSVSFNGRDAEPAILKGFGSGKLIIEGSLSFKREDTDPFQLETKISIKSPTSEIENPMKAIFKTSRFSPSKERALEPPMIEPGCPKHKAAVRLQKVYKSFRTRRQLADCAVLIEQRWWKLLDFALLKQSSVSFFDTEEPESVVSRWLRARRRAATVGKGLSKDEKARKLALQHWLEAIDPRHRYGHNLHFYYDCWIRCESRQPFFYWLDVGEGKDVNLEDQCPRSKLQQQCIKYLGPKEREEYEVTVEDGKFLHKRSRKLLDTSESPEDTKWIFVLSTSKRLYVGQKNKGTFQHSSFLAGGATSAAGRLVVENGILKAVWPHSGHYRPTKENFQEFMSFVKENKVDLTDVKLSPAEGDEEIVGLQSFHSEPDLTQRKMCVRPETGVQTSQAFGRTTNAMEPKSTNSFEPSNGMSPTECKSEREIPMKRCFNLEQYRKLHKNIMLKDLHERNNEADGVTNVFSKSERNDSSQRPNKVEGNCSADIQSGGCGIMKDSSICEGLCMFCNQNLFLEEQEKDEDASIPQELILGRINSKKGMKSYQLGKQLACKWTTGAGPRIGCVRDYPSELQFRALEQVNLSPKDIRPYPSPRPSPRITPVQSPRMPEIPLLRKVPLLQLPNIRR